ncbi:protein yellow-like [Aedes aegypti]|uniref:Uncharacterized protein n=1 Tax=Aedes aegypti TaxID=7159 RepID=A0A903VNC4_AEDAE|nr:protein yellow-like [Aedes aegypti]
MGVLGQIPLLIGVILFLRPALANDNLRVAYQWSQIDFEFPSEAARSSAIASGDYIAENVIPVGLEVYKRRLFLTLPRWKAGIPASLAYININGEFTSCITLVVFTSLPVRLFDE